MAFNHTDLALDSSGFFAQGMQVAIVGMDASAWEIRNSASLMYAALIMRMLGFRNLQKGELPRRAVTAADFFHRYPSLHSFLLQRLQRATQQLPAGFTGQQPSLFPILALLGRLRPSAAARKSDRDQHPLSPEAFVPLALLCGKAQPMAVRSLAAQSLAAVAPLGDSALVDHLLSQLPAAKEPISSQNLAHGTLLQLQQLVMAAALQGPPQELPSTQELAFSHILQEQNLKHSGLLKLKAASTALGDDQQAWTLAAWWATISLMEDEDEDVQSATASAAASAILGDGSASGAHVDWVQRRSFAFLFDDVGESPQHLQHLLDWIYSCRSRGMPCSPSMSTAAIASKVEQLIIWLGGIAKDLGSLVDRLQEQSGLEHTSAVLQVGTFRTAVFEQLTRALLGVQVAQAAFTDELRDAISMSVQQLKQLPLHPVLESLLDGAWSRLASAQDTALLKQGLGISVHELGHSRQPGLVLGSLTESF
ncbi:hypothetical protein WJX84_007987 [Apatococcus fuscideae]|uniref:tRNA (32-2'-O)-methyltransferase regulator THADA-like C-terminal TPR repeats region domain-containing protein n=1 Tax=Apatococcus fuscideae TaxID=2026836 RepID=A0AAW1T614_9CHLO